MNTALAAPPAKLSFKAQMLQAREDAIVQAVIRLLGEKGFDAMTVDEVRRIIEQGRGRHFDPDMVDLFLADYNCFVQIAAQDGGSGRTGPMPLQAIVSRY